MPRIRRSALHVLPPGLFLARLDYTVNALPRAIQAADLDRDGDQDLVVVGTGYVNVLWNVVVE